MKSAVFYGKHQMKVEDFPKPSLGDEDVLIEVKVCGICGTDVHIYEGDEGAAPVTPPTILGHEFSGIITEIGKNVKTCKIGDRVSVDPNCYCGKCEACRNGSAHFCNSMVGYGTTTNGGFAEFCAVNQSQVYVLGKNTSFEQGAMGEPVACCLHGIDMCNIKASDQIVVIGGGMIGLLMMQLAKISGAAKVALVEPVESKREVAKTLGADLCIDPINQDVKAVLRENGMTWINTVIECVGKTFTIEQAIDIVDPQGTVMMFGLTKPDETINLKPFQVFQKEIVLKSSFINPYTQKRALDLIDSKKINVDKMICEVASLEKLELILSDPKLRAMGKYLIDPSL